MLQSSYHLLDTLKLGTRGAGYVLSSTQLNPTNQTLLVHAAVLLYIGSAVSVV